MLRIEEILGKLGLVEQNVHNKEYKKTGALHI